MPRAIPSLLALLACALLVSACGGSSSSDDSSAQITDTVTTALTTEDPAVLCRKSLATSWVSEVYGTVTKCVTIERADAKTNTPATAAEVSGIKVDGDRATAFVEAKGGTNDGARGELSLAKEDGDWRISSLSTALLRSQFEAGAKNDRELPKDLKACVVDEVTGLTDADLRTLAVGSIGKQPKAQAALQAIVTKCLGQTSSSSSSSSGTSSETASVLRRQFEQGVSESLKKDGISQTAIACVKRELRSAISDEQIVSLIGKSSKQVPQSITKSTAAALAACGAVK
jgi:hypothetical protein